jgi:hypothetical protein
MNYTSGLLLVLLITIVVFASAMGPSMWRWAMGVSDSIGEEAEEGFQASQEKDLKKSAEKLAEDKIKELQVNSQTQLDTLAKSSDGELSKYPIPWQKFEEKTMVTDKTQDRHIEDIRRVLATTITTLVEDDVLPAGTSQNCDAAPVVNAYTGKVDPADGCRPPGWLRMMNARNERNGMPF